MARKIFFSFYYKKDSWRVSIVRNSGVIGSFEKTPFYDKAGWEKIKQQGDDAVKNWIDNQLRGTSVTVVLIGSQTASRRWVKYEIAKSIELGKGLIGIDISKINDQNGEDDVTGTNPLPAGYKKYLWYSNKGGENLAKWVEQAAVDAGY